MANIDLALQPELVGQALERGFDLSAIASASLTSWIRSGRRPPQPVLSQGSTIVTVTIRDELLAQAEAAELPIARCVNLRIEQVLNDAVLRDAGDEHLAAGGPGTLKTRTFVIGKLEAALEMVQTHVSWLPMPRQKWRP